MTIIRLAVPSDAKAILDIYAPFVINTSLTFETEVPSVKDFAERIGSYLESWPWLVCEIDNKIVGYAYGAKYRERSGYQWCVESSVYVLGGFQKLGVASVLYEVLFTILKEQGYNNVYAVINLPNEQSVTFHEKMGFEYFATYKNVGYKLGKWKNVGWWQLVINEYVDKPLPPRKFSDLDKKFLDPLFKTSINKINKSA